MSDASVFEKMDLFYLGREVDPDSGKTGSVPLLYKNKNLTTHAAIIGMTGSGKTGLGIGLLEEAALDRLPAIVIDPKGDMGNLLLTFPDMKPSDFLPWIDQAKADQKKMTREELAEETAVTWEKGIESWGQDRERIARLRANVDLVVYTPGSTSGRAVSVLDSLDAPEPSVVEDNDTLSSLVNASVSSILGLIGIQADPLKSREHILLSSIILHHWRRQRSLSLEDLIGNVVSPPLERIGVFPLDSFYSQTDRMELAMLLNNILASPAFSGWTQGEPLQIERMLYTENGMPRISIFSIAHLSEPERMFFVTMLLGKLVSWMRQQEGSSGLRGLLYMDEIFGYFPPSANPPSKKPMLLLLKQARAYGLGIVLATQNPVDLDYKGLANIGTWFVGRLQTRQDQDKVLAGIAGSSEKSDIERMRNILAGMRSRTFLMTSAHYDAPVLFEARWALSYLRGPISLSELSRLIPEKEEDSSGERQDGIAAGAEIIGNRELQDHPPILPDTVEQCFVLPQVPLEEPQFSPWLAGSASVRFYSQSRGIDIVNEIRLRLPLAGGVDFDWSAAEGNPFAREDMVLTPPPRSRFRLLPGAISSAGAIKEQGRILGDYLYQSMKLELVRIPSLKLESRPGEHESRFRKRLADMLRERKEGEMKKIEESFMSSQASLEQKRSRALNKIEKEKGDVRSKGMDTALSFGVAVFGALFGRKAMSVTTASRSARGVRSAERLMKEKEDVRMAEEELQRIEQDIAALAAEYREKTVEISDRFSPEKFPAEKFFIKPRRADIFNVSVIVQWEPQFELNGLR